MSRPFSLAVCLLSLALAVSLFASASAAEAGKYRVYFGTYTGQKSRGIYTADLDLATGKLTEPRLAAEAVSPSFLTIHPSGHWLYAVSEIDDLNGRKTGGVSAFAIEAARLSLVCASWSVAVNEGMRLRSAFKARQ